MSPIWIADDDASIRFVLERALAREGLAVRSFAQAAEVLGAMQEEGAPGVLVTDIRMPGLSGLELLAQISAEHPRLPVIVMTAFSDLDSAVQAFQRGAYDYLAKPFDVPHAVALIRRALAEAGARGDAGPPVGPASAQATLLGQAPAMQALFRAIGRLSSSDATVLITGESGSGKELVARALHDHSPRGPAGRDGPFIAINTAAIPRDLLESELFGHERGAFTGAQATRRGRFEQAEGGTLFLDEIGDMPLELQTRLLRVLSDGAYYRVGGQQPIRSDVRVLAATHQDLEARVREGSFREDLFHRLNVIRLRVPPLRERREDIPLLAQRFLQASAQRLRVPAKRLSAEALAHLQAMPFTGNVRELENLCDWLTVMAPGREIRREDFPAPGAALRGGLATAPAAGPAGGSPLGAPAGDAAAGGAVAASPGLASALGSALASGAEAQPVAPAGDGTTPPQTEANGSSLGASTAMASTGLAAAPAADGAAADALAPAGAAWLADLAADCRARLEAGESDIWEALNRQFEATLIRSALAHTHGRRIEAAQRLGIGRNTLTRKIQELKL